MSYIAKNGRLYTSGASEALTLLDDKFSVNKSYSKGDGCIYNDYLWKFTSDKPAGEWDSSVVEQCRIMDFIGDANGRLTQVQTQIVPTASIESGATASRAYLVGEYLVKGGSLWKATTNIAKGDSLTVARIAPVTVCGELSSSSTDKWTFKKLTGTDNEVTVPSGAKEIYLCCVNTPYYFYNSVIIPIEIFNDNEILKFYSYASGSINAYIMRTSTENVYSVHNTGLSFSIFGYR